jgi:hypothetical protein
MSSNESPPGVENKSARKLAGDRDREKQKLSESTAEHARTQENDATGHDNWLLKYLAFAWILISLASSGPHCIGFFERAKFRYGRFKATGCRAFRWGSWEQIQRCVDCVRRRR